VGEGRARVGSAVVRWLCRMFVELVDMNAPDTTSTQETFTESAAFRDLVKWAASRPMWQQDASRRLVQNGALSEADLEELAALCLDGEAPAEPISGKHIAEQNISGEAIALLAIANPQGINALAPDQTLEIAREGLTVIYGDNGSGKSGYVRILKHACRTRDRNQKILRDIEDTTESPQSAIIRLSRGGIEESFDWSPTGPSHPDLPSVSIFDSRSANVHVEVPS
jgi:hypothetical protein